MTLRLLSTKQRAMLALSAAFVLAMLLFAFCRPRPTPIPPKEGKTLDSLKATDPDFRGRVDTIVRRETTYLALSRQNRAGATQAQHRADSLLRVAIVADSVARAQGDSSSRWFASAQAWHRAADSLGVAVVRLGLAYSAESTARVSADARADEFERRLTATTDLNTRLATDLRRAERPCRVLFVAKCPSRKTAALVGLGAGYLVSRADVRRATSRAVHDGLRLVLP